MNEPAGAVATRSLPDWHWRGESGVDVDGVGFTFAAIDGGGLVDDHLVLKDPVLVRAYQDLLHTEEPRRIVELGMKAGGSTALLAVAARPEVLVGVDLADGVPPTLARLIEERELSDVVVPRPGIDQGDRVALAEAVLPVLDGSSIDLVVDDASHVLEPTRTSFDLLFPHIRPGGLYVIEDWCQEYRFATTIARVAPGASRERIDLVRAVIRVLNTPGASLPDSVVDAMAAAHASRPVAPSADGEVATAGIEGLLDALVLSLVDVDADLLRQVQDRSLRPLVDLGIELVMAAARADGTIADVRFDRDWIAVRRGAAPIDPGSFRLGSVAADHFGYLPVATTPEGTSGDGPTQGEGAR